MLQEKTSYVYTMEFEDYFKEKIGELTKSSGAIFDEIKEIKTEIREIVLEQKEIRNDLHTLKDIKKWKDNFNDILNMEGLKELIKENKANTKFRTEKQVYINAAFLFVGGITTIITIINFIIGLLTKTPKP